ncbi:MAG: alpha-glucuronidase [Saprospiraceae bacterium]|nr:alpha-glucuronidase [Saprospiraceae bacterium]
MKKIGILLILFTLSLNISKLKAEDGYRLWLRYDLISNAQKLQEYRRSIQAWLIEGDSPTLSVAKNELQNGINGLLGQPISNVKTIQKDGIVVAATLGKSALLTQLNLNSRLEKLNLEGFLILNTTINQKKVIVIAGKEDIGVLYGVFHFLKLLQTHQNIEKLNIESSPKVKLRILNHWDNLDRTVERGYAGFSIWDWHKLPDYLDPRYTDYARANASIGINGTVLTNVNANALVLTPAYLEKVAALADLFRPYGIKVYLTARFSAPIEIGGLKTADPLDPQVQTWWKNKINEIYQYVPDFGGFVVKANSEGQPGPQNYQRSHADGANMLADALAPHNGVVMWRAFVYDNNVPDDRAKQAYNEFKPLDGTFRSNVLIQVKNGPIDFQPREPFHPLFGAMPKTPLMMEFQITQEYLGQATNLVYLATMWKECLESDTYAKGQGSTVAKVIDGTLHEYSMTSMAGVANIGNERNWTGHPFGQANWYAFGRLAWNHELTAAQIAEDWIRMTFSNDNNIIKTLQNMMLNSHETVVKHSTPLGLHHIMGAGHHYGPGPWVSRMSRADWTSVYYHRADSMGVGFNRTSSGSDALSQYFPEVQAKFGTLENCPEAFLLWFHHVNWDYKMKSGQTLWAALCHQYYQGVEEVRQMQKSWDALETKIDETRFAQVKALLKIQEKEAIWWRNSCVLYFQTFSKQAIPKGLEQPEKSLEYYQKLSFPYAPGIRPQW